MEPTQRKSPDSILLLITALFATCNVVLMTMYAKSLLGPVPFELIIFFMAVSAVATVAVFPLYFAFRGGGLTLSATIAATLTFAGLTWFNYFWLVSASAAV